MEDRMTERDRNKANAAAYAYDIDLLASALGHLGASPAHEEERTEIKQRLRILLDLGESK
jgi:hypothetical protein